MKRSQIAPLIGLLALVVSCGNQPAETPSVGNPTLGEQLTHYENQSSNQRSAVRRLGGTNDVCWAGTSLLDLIYGKNTAVTRIALGGLGGNFLPYGYTGGAVSVFDKDANGKFQLTSGNPLQVRGISTTVFTLFLAYQTVPIAAGGAGFCAGVPGRAIQSGALALGVGISLKNGYAVPLAGAVLRNGSQYQACDLRGCTQVTNIPVTLQNLFPECSAVMY